MNFSLSKKNNLRHITCDNGSLSLVTLKIRYTSYITRMKSYIPKPKDASDSALMAADAPAPSMLGEAARVALRELLAQGESKNTVRSYQAAMRYWASWFRLRFGSEMTLPVSVDVAAQFVLDHAQRTSDEGLITQMPPEIDEALVSTGVKARLGPLKLSTLEHRLSVLAAAHRNSTLVSPTLDAQIRELLVRVRRGYAARGQVKKRLPALTREPLEELLATCDSSLTGMRDRALLLFAWGSGGRRRSEIAQARVENLRRLSPTSFVYELRVSKTNQEGAQHAGNEKPLVGKVAQALDEWLRVSGIKEGALFRRIRRGSHLGSDALSPAAIREIVKTRAKLANLDEAFSTHSLRSGFITEAAVRGVPLPEAMAMSGHKSLAVFQGYFRPDVSKLQSASLLDQPVE
ncbi:site-specific integrase [Nostoc sp. CHAB 5834]|nr:site-specific integrase [Nostoc sp. CHAB 5834]